MSREIKFRVWNISGRYFEKDKECPMVINQYGDMGEVGQYNLTKSCVAFFTHEAENYVLQQFTGFKDSQNQDIFEGDIIEVCNGEINAAVIWSDSNGRWELDSLTRPDYGRRYPDDLGTYFTVEGTAATIVGNIFETKR